jgi:glucose/arabinose dehydrogenase
MKQTTFFLIAVVSILFSSSCNGPAKNTSVDVAKSSGEDSIEVKLELVTSGLGIPVELKDAPDTTNRKFISDNSGKIWILKKDSLLPIPFFTSNNGLGKADEKSPVGAIFSVAFHPMFLTNHQFYVCYAAPSSDNPTTGKLVVSEFTASNLDKDLADAKSEYRVLEVEGRNINNNGAQVAFGPDGYLYISIGDDQLGDSLYVYHAQDLNFLNGKLLRIDVNKKPYAIPADNPFVAIKNARPEIWAYGFRKMWRFCFDSLSHQLFGADVGQEKEEEIDIVKKGSNYGWPAKEGDSSFLKLDSINESNFTAPIFAYTHKDGICIIGGNFYYGTKIPLLNKKYVFADFNGSMFAIAKSDTGTWLHQPLKILNKPTAPFLICGFNIDSNNEIYVMGLLNYSTGPKGVVYKVVKI